MSFLIDTHTFLWASTAPEKLSKVAEGILNDHGSAILVSVVVP